MTTEPAPELLACPNPWCKSPSIKLISYTPSPKHLPRVNYGECQACGLKGPSGKTEAEAIVAWNTRARPSAPEVAGEVCQADRDAAAIWWRFRMHHIIADEIAAGKNDHKPQSLAQAFARHRLAHATPPAGEMPWYVVVLDKARTEIITAANALCFAAETSGGTAGPDTHLQAMISAYVVARNKYQQIAQIVHFEWNNPKIGAGLLSASPQAPGCEGKK